MMGSSCKDEIQLFKRDSVKLARIHSSCFLLVWEVPRNVGLLFEFSLIINLQDIFRPVTSYHQLIAFNVN